MKKYVYVSLFLVFLLSGTLMAQKTDVLPKEKSYYDLYPIAIGNLRTESNQFNFGNAKNTEIITDTLKVYNEWRLPLNIDLII